MAIDGSSEHLFSSLHTCTGEVQRCLRITNYRLVRQVNAVQGVGGICHGASSHILLFIFGSWILPLNAYRVSSDKRNDDCSFVSFFLFFKCLPAGKISPGTT